MYKYHSIYRIIFALITGVSLELRSDISFKLIQINAYDDDIALIARTKKALIEIFSKISEEATLEGLHIHEDTTKYVHIQKTG
jgi:short-subunit dehydrogenase